MSTPGFAAPFRRNRLAFGVATVLLAVGAAIVTLVSLSLPYGSFDGALLGLALGGLAVVSWLVAGTLALLVRRFSPLLLVPPVLLVLVLLADRLDLPLGARFAAARPAFEDAVAARGEAGPEAPCPERVGSYRVYRCVTEESITRFTTAGGFLDAVGFAYAPDGVPGPAVGDGAVNYELLTGYWYRFTQSW